MKPSEIRKKFLQGAAPLMDEMLLIACGEKDGFDSKNDYAIKETWDLMREIIKSAEDPHNGASLTNSDIAGRVDAVLADASSGSITLEEARKLMGLLRDQVEISVIPELADKLALLGNRK